MNKNDQKLLSQMIKAGKFNMEIADLLKQKYADDTKEMIKTMGSKYALHPANAPVKGTYQW